MSTKSKSIHSKGNFSQDDRLKKVSNIRILLNRPELGALGGAILVFIFFGIVAGDTGMFSAYGMLNFLDVSANLGIIAIAAAMLMIGGEFDLSIGSMIGFAGICIAIPAIYWLYNLDNTVNARMQYINTSLVTQSRRVRVRLLGIGVE